MRNTAPFLFEDDIKSPQSEGEPGSLPPPYVRILRQSRGQVDADTLEPVDGAISSPMGHFDYFALCLSAHHATVATYVPTDVDNQIRFRLWNPALETPELEKMARLVLESRTWDCTPVSTRVVASSVPGPALSGHLGEWFSTAAGAYGALRRRSPRMAAEVAGEILREIRRHAEIFESLKREGRGIDLLRACCMIAHNLGDLDRVIEMWNLPGDDLLKQEVFKLGREEGSMRALAAAGAMNKAHMAHENHRHFALRGPRCLRTSADFLLPIGPFFDDWGARIGRHPGLSPENVAEIVAALADGWAYLRKHAKNAPAPVGYARAIAGILDTFPGGMGGLSRYVPARLARELKSGPLRSLTQIGRRRFEEKLHQIALAFDTTHERFSNGSFKTAGI